MSEIDVKRRRELIRDLLEKALMVIEGTEIDAAPLVNAYMRYSDIPLPPGKWTINSALTTENLHGSGRDETILQFTGTHYEPPKKNLRVWLPGDLERRRG